MAQDRATPAIADLWEIEARAQASWLCGRLRAKGDALSMAAAAEIEGALEAFAGAVASQRALATRLSEEERTLRDALALCSSLRSGDTTGKRI